MVYCPRKAEKTFGGNIYGHPKDRTTYCSGQESALADRLHLSDRTVSKWERNQPLTPPCSQPPTTAQRSPVAGHPAADKLTRHFVNNNKKTACVSGRNSVKYAYETAEAYKAGRGEGQLPTPLCRRQLKPSPTQQKFSAPKVHYNGFPGNNQWGNQWLVCVASAV